MHAQIMKEKARALQDTSRNQLNTSGLTETYHSSDATAESNRAKDFSITFDEAPFTELAANKEYKAAVEAKQIAQQEAQDTPRSQQTTPGKPSTQPQT